MPPLTALHVDRVLYGLVASDSGGVFSAVAHDLADRALVRNAEAVRAALEARERAQSTALAGAGIAMPHARIAGQKHGVVALVRLAKPVVFAGADPSAVDLVVVIVSPADDPAEHVKQLARIARKLHDPACVTRLREARDAGELRSALEDV